jgi:hypothetical protein
VVAHVSLVAQRDKAARAEHAVLHDNGVIAVAKLTVARNASSWFPVILVVILVVHSRTSLWLFEVRRISD